MLGFIFGGRSCFRLFNCASNAQRHSRFCCQWVCVGYVMLIGLTAGRLSGRGNGFSRIVKRLARGQGNGTIRLHTRPESCRTMAFPNRHFKRAIDQKTWTQRVEKIANTTDFGHLNGRSAREERLDGALLAHIFGVAVSVCVVFRHMHSCVVYHQHIGSRWFIKRPYRDVRSTHRKYFLEFDNHDGGCSW